MSAKPLIYLSYSGKDRTFVDEFLRFMKPVERLARYELWHGELLQPGADWQKSVHDALLRADVAVIFVSADYLSLEWILQQELPVLIGRQARGEVRIIPIIVRPAIWVHTQIAYLQVWPRDGQALSELPVAERDRVWRELCDVLLGHIYSADTTVSSSPPVKHFGLKSSETKRAREGKRTEAAPDAAQSASSAKRFFISHAHEDGDFAEILKFRMTEAGFESWIDIDVLEAGQDWRQEIDEAILGSAAVILVLSPDSKASEYVTYEWAFALGAELQIIPLLLRETPIHPRLEVFQYLDFTNRRARPWDRLFNLLRQTERKPKKAQV